jgi:glutathione S-transferase
MRLYFHPLSSNSRRVTMTAQQLGLELDLIIVDLLKGEHKDPEFLRFNPNGRVPLLEDDGFYLWESHAIMQYLADRSPDQTLYPHDARARADINRWLFWSAYHFTPAVGFISTEKSFKEDGGWIRRSRCGRNSTWRVVAHRGGAGARRPSFRSTMDRPRQADAC